MAAQALQQQRTRLQEVLRLHGHPQQNLLGVQVLTARNLRQPVQQSSPHRIANVLLSRSAQLRCTGLQVAKFGTSAQGRGVR